MKLDHVQLAMPAGKEGEARAFFTGILAMREEKKPTPLLGRGGCWFRKNGVIIHVGVADPFVPQQKAHVAFVVADLDRLAEDLNGAGFDVIWDGTLPDRHRFFSTDPFGNRLEFLRDGDGFSQR